MPELESSPPFKAVAPFYDELMKSVPYQMWVGYYMLLLITADCHPHSMLELGCGTGIITELLFKEGFDVTGLDLSPEMVHLAAEKARKHKQAIQYIVANAANFKLERKFDAIYSFFDSLNNITDPHQLHECFLNVLSHLEPGGSFIFDLNTPYAFEHKMFDQKHLKKEASLKYKWLGKYDPDSRIVTVTMNFWKDGHTFTEVHHQRAYSPSEITAMLEDAGFTSIHAYHSYTLDKPRKNSDRVHFSCKRPLDLR